MNKSSMKILLILIALTIIVNPVSAYNTEIVTGGTTGSGYVYTDNTIVVQKVLLNHSNKQSILGANISLIKSGTPSSFNVYLYADNYGTPGTLIYSQGKDQSIVGATCSLVNIGVTGEWLTSYYGDYVYVGMDYVDSGLDWLRPCQGTDTYSYGSVWSKTPTGTWTQNSSADMGFNVTFTYGDFDATTSWDKTSYNIGETATISYTLTSPLYHPDWTITLWVYNMDTVLTDYYSREFDITQNSGSISLTLPQQGNYSAKMHYQRSSFDELGVSTSSQSYGVVGSTVTSFVDFDSEEYYRGSTATVEYGISPALVDFSSYNLKLYHENQLMDTVNVDGFGIQSFGVTNTGNYRIDLEACLLWSCSVIATDSAIGIYYPSYIGMPDTVIAGVLFDVAYSWGSQPGTQALGKWIYVDYFNPDTYLWEREQPYSVNQSTPNTLYNTTILTKKAGKYKVSLCDIYTSYLCPAAEKIITSNYGGNVPIENYTDNSINITAKQSSYSQGDYMTFTYFVSGDDFENKTISVEVYNNASYRNISVYHVQSESAQVNYFLSGVQPFESGANQLRLMGTNNSGRFVLAYDVFTMSVIDTEGYGLLADKYTVCLGEPVVVTAIVPIGVYARIYFTDDDVSESFNLTGTRTFKLNPYSDTSISLEYNNDQKKYTVINVVDTCGVAGPYTGVSSGDMGEGVKNLIYQWFGNSPSTSFIISIVIIILTSYLMLKSTKVPMFAAGGSILATGVCVQLTLLPMIWGVMFVILTAFTFVKMIKQGM